MKTKPNPELLLKIEKELLIEKNFKIKIKLLCLKAYFEGMQHKRISEIFNVPSRTLDTWKKLYRDGGYEAIIPRKQTGRPPKLNEDQLNEIVKFVDSRGLITLKEIERFIYDKFKVTYEASALYKMLSKKLNYTFKCTFNRHHKLIFKHHNAKI
ncbi:MAG: helix-turn-helix domain-containing protein [Cetobacterium sp.]